MLEGERHGQAQKRQSPRQRVIETADERIQMPLVRADDEARAGGGMAFGGGNPADAKVLDESGVLLIP